MNYNHSTKRNTGFTLIELLIVIAIIGLLSTIVLAGLSLAKKKAYDARRRNDLVQLRNALELYRVDHGEYPSTVETEGDFPDLHSKALNGGAYDVWIPSLAPGYLSKLPDDPTYSSPNFCGGWGGTYYYISNGKNYKLFSDLQCSSTTNVGSITVKDPFFDPLRPGISFMVTSNPALPAYSDVTTICSGHTSDEEYPVCW